MADSTQTLPDLVGWRRSSDAAPALVRQASLGLITTLITYPRYLGMPKSRRNLNR